MDSTAGNGLNDAESRTAPSIRHSAGRPANRFYADSAGSSLAASRGSTRSSSSARDRKRRLTSAGEDARLQRTRSSGTGPRTVVHARQSLPHRSASMLASSSRSVPGHDRATPPGSSYATAIDISSSPPGSSSPSASLGQTESSWMEDSRSRARDDGDLGISLARRRPAVGSLGNTQAIGSLSISPGEASAMSTEGQALGNGDDELMGMRVPRWQPDSEVTSCPICGTVFSFWYRKHHCRKCGRVVCASCSPHRITIPRQYIIRPPESTDLVVSSPTPTHPVLDLTQEPSIPSTPANSFPPSVSSNLPINPALGGGEEVRLCNPCVPDPNPNPLGYAAIRPRGHRSTQSLSSTMGNGFSRAFSSGTGASELTTSLGPFDEAGRGPWDLEHGQPQQQSTRSQRSARPQQSAQQPVPGDDQPPSTRRRRATALPGLFSHRHQHQPPVRSSPPPSQASLRPAVSEQECCPVCRCRFPPLSNEQPLEAREAHIRHCIASYGVSDVREETSTRQAPRAVAARMVDFTATEKDCLGSDGSLAECTICMEEYEVGQALARLECLCKFHKGCITDWFKRKRECPVHKGA